MPLYQLGPLADVMSYVGQVAGGRLGASCSICLPGSNTRRLLAACAKDVYAFEHDEGVSASLSYCPRSDRVQVQLGARGPNPQFCEWLRLEERQWENATRPDSVVQWGLYRVLRGPHQGKAILAIRVTESGRIKAVCSKGEDPPGPVAATWRTLIQDLDIVLGPGLLGLPIPWLGGQALIRQAIDHCVAAARKSGADFVCGHSLGGFLAECVCARTGIPGAAFNSPGPYTMGPTDCTGGAAFHGVPFEVHLTQLRTLCPTLGWPASPSGPTSGRRTKAASPGTRAHRTRCRSCSAESAPSTTHTRSAAKTR